MATVYRVQNSEGGGPYQDAFDNLELKNMESKHSDDKIEHPHPLKDSGIDRWPVSQELCGFISMEQLLNWFSEAEVEMMKDYGFNVVKLNGKITAQSERQVLFTPIDENKVMVMAENYDDIVF